MREKEKETEYKKEKSEGVREGGRLKEEEREIKGDGEQYEQKKGMRAK